MTRAQKASHKYDDILRRVQSGDAIDPGKAYAGAGPELRRATESRQHSQDDALLGTPDRPRRLTE